MPQLQLKLLTLFCGCLATIASATTFYVDSLEGNDSHIGTSPNEAWKTLVHVNGRAHSPGDRILFNAGCTWQGKLNPKGSGDAGRPIVIDMYGQGGKPLIDGNTSTGDGVVYFFNQQHWEVNNLQITNDAPTGGDRRGGIPDPRSNADFANWVSHQ